MAEKSRLQNSLLNLTSGFGYRIVSMLMAFVVRTVFIRCLSDEYLGVNGMYSSILSMLSLTELGFGTAMVYSMYSPLAEKDYKKLGQLITLYKKVYQIVGTVILVIGLSLIPFLDKLVKEQPDVKGLTFYYILFLLNSVVSYWFFAYRRSLLNADQKTYIVTSYESIFVFVKSGLQIILLLFFHSFTLYLLTQVLCTVGQNVAIAIKTNKMYPLFQNKTVEKLPSNETRKIFRDVKALMLLKVSHVVLNSTDNIIISAFIGLKWTGLLSNFVLITDAVTAVLCQITNAITGSLGNFFAKEDRSSGYRLFCRVEFLNFWLYGFSTIALIVLMNPFVTLWAGEAYTMSVSTVIAISVNFFVAGFMNTLSTFRSTLGLFTQGQYRPLIVAAINVVLSIALSYVWGVTGVLAATAISRACVNLWYDPWMIHRKGFHTSVKPFFIKYAGKLGLLVTITVVTYVLVEKVVFATGITMGSFVIAVGLVAIIPNAVFIAVFFKTDEFSYFAGIIKNIFAKFHK